MPEQIRLVLNKDIDRTLWDSCIERNSNGHIYAKSYYLDVVSPNWNALVFNDYETVFPLTWRKKYGITYLFQPFFTQQLGLFGNSGLVVDFIKFIKSKYLHINIQLNHQVKLGNERKNFVLNLSDSLEKIKSNYSKQTKRNLARSSGENLNINFSISPKTVIEQFIINKDHEVKGLCRADYVLFENLVNEVKKHTNILTISVELNNQILSSAVLFQTSKRLVLMMLSSSEEGMKRSASTYLISSLIEKFESQHLLLDFEGSQIAGLERFYKGFGSQNQPYSTFKKSVFPFL